MPGVSPVCGGLDGHAAQLTAWLRRGRADGPRRTDWRACGTTDAQLLALRAWLAEPGCPSGVRERTGGYWTPISHVVVATLAGVVAQARAVRPRPGKQTDKAAAAWLAALWAHGVVEPRCLPPPAGPALRELPRTRVALVQTRPHVQTRLSTR